MPPSPFWKGRRAGGTHFQAVGHPAHHRVPPRPTGSSALAPLQGLCQRLTPHAMVPRGQGPTEEFPPSFRAGRRLAETSRRILKVRKPPSAGGGRQPSPPRAASPQGRSRPATRSAGVHRSNPASPARLLPPARKRAACASLGLGHGEYLLRCSCVLACFVTRQARRARGSP